MISTSSSNGSPRSKHATTRPPSRSNGSSPPPTWPTSWTDSTATDRRSAPTQHNPERPDPRRTYERDHLAAAATAGTSVSSPVLGTDARSGGHGEAARPPRNVTPAGVTKL